MSTTLSQYKSQYTTAKSTFSTAVENLYTALQDLMALEQLLAQIDPGGVNTGQYTSFGQGARAYLTELPRHLEHPSFPRQSHTAFSQRLHDRATASAATYRANWSGT